MTTQSTQIRIKPEPLTAEAFAPFGAVIEPDRHQLSCTEGEYTARLMTLEKASNSVGHINRHPDHEQLFVPLEKAPMLIVVAPKELSGDGFDPSQVRAFLNDGTKAWTFATNVWHIAPRALSGEPARVINVQGSEFMEHTELIKVEPPVQVEL